MDNSVVISDAVFITLGIELLFALALPIAAAVVWKKKSEASLPPLAMGAAAFFLFTMVLEQLMHVLVLGVNPAIAGFIQGNPWVYAVYGGLAAGIFEETARFLVFRTMMKKYPARPNAVMYGIGHGGIECILVLGMTMVSNLLLAVMFNSLGAEAFAAQYAPEQADAVLAAVAQINAIDVPISIAACVERVVAMALQIELSVLVFAAVFTERRWLFPAAILLHAAFDFIAGLYQTGIFPSIYVMEALLLAIAVALFFVARRVYQTIPKGGQRVLARRL